MLDEWVVDMRARGLSSRTGETRWYQVSAFAIHCHCSVRKVKAIQVSEWIGENNLSLSTRAGRRAGLNEFFKYCVRMEVIERNPLDNVPGIKRKRKIARQPAPEEAVGEGIHAQSQEARLMVTLCSEAGLRREEASKIAGTDIVEYGDGWGLVVHGKGGKDRIVPIDRALALEIRDTARDGWLFPGRFSGHCCVDHVYRVIKRNTGYAPHSFRRRFGRVAYEVSNHDLRAVQQLLGHESPVTTQSYIFVPDSDLSTIMKRVTENRPERC